jgi:cobyrinic acid a,c-diamide synthase
LESRHLGLVTAGEIADLRERAALLGNAAAACVDLDAVVALAESAAELADAAAENFGARTFSGVRIAVARDAAFCFVYEDSLEVLRGLGAELVPFSPLADARLPEGVSGLILPGGYPELYAARLSANAAMRGAVREAVAAGLPTIAECGGFMYLLERLDGLEMAGAVPGEARMTGRLGRFGYFNMTAKRDNLLCGAGETISAHEFHYSESRAPDGAHGDFVLTKPGAAQPRGETGVGTETLYAAYPHLHFAGNAGAARRFLAKCAEYGAGR